jgi:hypothetical protein
MRHSVSLCLSFCFLIASAAFADVKPIAPQNLVLQDYRSEANARWRFTLGNSITQVEHQSSNLFGTTQTTHTTWASDLTIRYNPTPALQLLAFSSSSQSRSKTVTPFAVEVDEESLDITHGNIGVRWDLPRTWRLGAASVQVGYAVPLSEDVAETVSVAYSMVSMQDPLLMYGRLGYSSVLDDFDEPSDVRSNSIWRLTMGGAFVVNYATSIGAAITVTYRSAERFEKLHLSSDTEARLRLSVNRLLSHRLSFEPYFDFRLDRTTGSFSGGINFSFSV